MSPNLKAVDIVNRQQQLQQIQNALSNLLDGKLELHFTALEYYGLEGIGKTRMLEQAKKEVLAGNLPLVVIDFRNGWSLDEEVSQSVLRFLGQICDQLDGRFSISSARAVLSDMPRQIKENISKSGDVLKQYIGSLLDALGNAPLVLTLDSMEHCPAELLNWIGREFIRLNVQAENSPGMVVFMAVHDPP